MKAEVSKTELFRVRIYSLGYNGLKPNKIEIKYIHPLMRMENIKLINRIA